jgi:hypothetical protein
MLKDLHFGNWLQIAWLIIGIIFQIWIGGIKGLILFIVVTTMFFINSYFISTSTYDLKLEALLSQKSTTPKRLGIIHNKTHIRK